MAGARRYPRPFCDFCGGITDEPLFGVVSRVWCRRRSYRRSCRGRCVRLVDARQFISGPLFAFGLLYMFRPLPPHNVEYLFARLVDGVIVLWTRSILSR